MRSGDDEPQFGDLAPLTFTVIPCGASCPDGRVPHAVLDGVLLAVHHDTTGDIPLSAVCGHTVVPDPYLPADVDLCAGCREWLARFDAIPRPALGEPMLNDLARIHVPGPQKARMKQRFE
jgi:hypothetical protein